MSSEIAEKHLIFCDRVNLDFWIFVNISIGYELCGNLTRHGRIFARS